LGLHIRKTQRRLLPLLVDYTDFVGAPEGNHAQSPTITESMLEAFC
jgi:hypothetical protein